jgi:hypothetical protein
LDPDWYRYLWRRIGPDGRLLAGILAAAVVALGGFFAVRAFASSGNPDASGYVRLTTTLTKVVTVPGHGGTVVEHVPIVRRILAKPVTVEQSTTVPGPTGTTVVTRRIVRYRPVYHRVVVTVHGRGATVKQVATDTRTVTSERVATVVQPVTNDRTSTVIQTVTVVRTQTSPAETVLVRQTPPTVTVTTTVAFMTVAIPTYTIP